MKLAYLFNSYPQPSQTALRREVLALEKMGIPIHRFTLRRYDGELVDEEDRAERDKTRVVLSVGASGLVAAVVRTAPSRPGAFGRALRTAIKAGWVSERGLFRNLVYLAEACVLRRWLAEREIGHVHAHYGTNAAMVAMLCRMIGGPPYSFTMHGPEEFDAPRALGLREKIRGAAFVVAITEFTRSQLYRWADYVDWPKIHVIRVGVSPMFLDHGPTPVPATPRLVNIGRIVEQKGQAILVQAAAGLCARGLEFELVIVGDGPMRGEIERLIEQLGLRGHVRITGYLSNKDVLQELLAARALVLPSFAEGLPGVFFESMAVGRPVISTFIAAHSELIEPGINGWLVPAGAVEPLLDAMAEALTANTAELEAMGRAGAARVAERHDVAIEVKKLADLDRGVGDQLSTTEFLASWSWPPCESRGSGRPEAEKMSNLGIVTIGRNEGERLRCCLNSLVGRGLPVVYVDSNSTDGSVDLARSLGVEVVELDLSLPFTAARARNAGFARLEQVAPEVEFVQFVDGDCEVAAGWLDTARAVLEERPDVAVVFGRRRERFRDATVYNRLADLEWDIADRRGQSLRRRRHDSHGSVPPRGRLQPVDHRRRG